MKIAFINHPTRIYSPPPESGSVEIWIHEVARRLARCCEVVVYSPRGPLSEEEWCDGVLYRRISNPGRMERIVRLIRKFRGGERLTRPLYDFRSSLYYIPYSLGVAKDLRAQRCDVIHVVNLSQFAPLLHTLNPNVKIVLHMHSEWLTYQDRRVIERRLKNVDKIFSCSDFLSNKIRSALPTLAERSVTLHNGVDVDRFRENGACRNGVGVRRILFATRISPEKGLHVLLDAFAVVARRCPFTRLEIAGAADQISLDVLPSICSAEEVSRLARFYDGKGYLAHLKEQIDRLELGHSVVFTGLLPHSQLAQRYREADVLVSPSVCNELFGMSNAEAMSSGVPVVATRVGGVPEVIEDGKTGFLVDPNDPAALAEAILALLENQNLRRRMGEAARRRAVELFSWERIVTSLTSEYGDICEHRTV